MHASHQNCNVTHQRLGTGEIVRCNMALGHGGPWHYGWIASIGHYKWPNR